MPFQPNPDLAVFLQSLPKTETHLHLEGSMPFEALQRAFPGRYRRPPDSWADDYRFPNFGAFMDQYVLWCAEFFVSAERYHEAARLMLAKCAAQNVRYVETSFHLPVLAQIKATGPDVVRAIRSAAPPGVEVRVFAGMCHNDYIGATREIIEDALGWDDLTGLDLHGPEDLPLEPWTADVWARARAAGKFNKAHAGEFMPADYVARTLDELAVTRIEHGNGAEEDPQVIARLVRDQVTLDMCPISNLKLKARGLTTLRDHPIRRFLAAGVRVTVNSDDTFMFGNTLTEDYAALALETGLTRSELVRLARNGFEAALLPDDRKRPFFRDLDAIAATLG